MLTGIAIVLLFTLIASGQQVAIALGLVATILLLFSLNVPSVTLAHVAFSSLDSYALVAIPFFILAGNLATKGNIAEMIFATLGSILRCVRGGMAISLLVAAVFFAAINGSSVACAAALGPAATRVLPQEGYPKGFAAALVAVGGTLGIMIPPSLSFILIGAMMQLPITDLFIAGIIPGLLEASLLAVATVWMSWRNKYGIKTERPDWRDFGKQSRKSGPALLLPVFIIGGIYFGVMTPTEDSGFAVVYAAILALIVYRTIDLKGFWETSGEAVLQSTMIFMVVMAGSLLAFLLTRLGLTTELINLVQSLGIDEFTFLIVTNVVLLILGCVFDGVSLIILTAPVLFPIATALGINPIHFAVIMTALVEIATITPPVGLNLFVMSQITGIKLEGIVKAVIRFYGVRLFALVLINTFPWLSLALL
ncbi:TRAP transporter large permease [Reyranella sp.]|jgi:C4-dicarboxylate transporter DctM subunit|uniref:TRAP transporter large permease n=1 Tax=Reyranella sp. TaxID=1929291 RepID=UPI0011F7CAFE|nr:TRAP transporter large permease [Reyranella sp.]TAJ81431.1 MAG: TRAP transporter large permease [Reyranella sp.]